MEIKIAHEVQTVAYAASNGVPWHGLGAALPKNQPIEVWQQQAGMNFEIKQTHVLFNAATGDGNILNLRSNPDATVLYRSDSNGPGPIDWTRRGLDKALKSNSEPWSMRCY